MDHLRERFIEQYAPLIGQFLDGIRGMDVTGIPAPHIPIMGQNYETAKYKMLVRMHQLVKEYSQFIISTHSPILMAYPGATIYQLTENGLHKTEYEKTEHYMLMKYFLNNTDQYLKDIGIDL